MRKITLANAVSSTLAGGGALTRSFAGASDGTGTAAGFNGPRGLALDGAGDVFLADAGNGALRQVLNVCGGGEARTTTAAGGAGFGVATGSGTAATFTSPFGVAVIAEPPVACGGGGANGSLLLADWGANLLRNVSLV